jgi:oxygen-independent coproporphyrinogen-3 oxidase
MIFFNMVYWCSPENIYKFVKSPDIQYIALIVKKIDYSIYLHIPFCRHRCSYCDFNTYAGMADLIPAYIQALCREIQLLAESANARLPVRTVFLGGGTPSLLPLSDLERVFSILRHNFELLPGLEVTLEANPGTVSLSYLQGLNDLGVNRLSLGMQSALSTELRLLEREHEFGEVVQAVNWARRAGFKNLNLDLIFGLPYQTLPAWAESLENALALQPEHFSLYALTLEHGTPMQQQVELSLLPAPDPDLAADMYESASELLQKAGYVQYEISNWACSAGDGAPMVCRHNLQYWRNQPYLGLGAGAHGYAGGIRTANVLAPSVYIQRCLDGEARTFPRTPATAEAIQVERSAEISETMMMGLRLVQEGISNRNFQERFGENLKDVFGKEIERLRGLGLLEWTGSEGDILRLSQQGRLLGNQVFMEFI